VADPDELPAEEAEFEPISRLQENPFPFEWYRLIDESHFWFQWRLSAAMLEVRELGLPLGRPLHGLEIGGGTGVLRAQFEAATAWVVDMTDLQADALRLARPSRGRTLYYDVTERHPDFVGRYDVVVLFDVLEHIPQPRPFLAATLEHLRPGGTLLINVPAMQSLFSGYDAVAGHVRRYDKPGLVAEFDGLPLEVTGARYWGASLVPLLAVRKALLALRPRSEDETIRLGFEPPNRLIHALLRLVMRLESAVVASPVMGTSLVLSGRRLGG
jgi:SAM-dependent methyltransferase